MTLTLAASHRADACLRPQVSPADAKAGPAR
jgi:hypothetical protein